MSTMQDSLFDARPLLAAPEVKPPVVDTRSLAAIAFLYTITEKGTATGIRFGATLSDARLWCSSPLSAGTMHGIRWAYAYTSALNYLTNREGWIPEHGGWPDMTLALDADADNGTWDERIASTGCTKIGLPELADLLRACGVVVTINPTGGAA